MWKKLLMMLLSMACLAGCGHTSTTKVGVISFGNLEGKVLPEIGSGPVLSGKNCGHSYRLSEAVRDALKGTEYDTLTDVVITNETALLAWNNCFIVGGNALNSKTLPSVEVKNEKP